MTWTLLKSLLKDHSGTKEPFFNSGWRSLLPLKPNDINHSGKWLHPLTADWSEQEHPTAQIELNNKKKKLKATVCLPGYFMISDHFCEV